MKVLLDTHTFLWFGDSDPQLSNRARSLIADPANQILVSPASYWELAIKVSVGNYQIVGMSYEQFWRESIVKNRFRVLPIRLNHCERLSLLTFHHKDPFDRMLVAQSLADKLLLISNDTRLDLYGVRRAW